MLKPARRNNVGECGRGGDGGRLRSDFTLLIGANINSIFSAMMDADHQGSLDPAVRTRCKEREDFRRTVRRGCAAVRGCMVA